MRRYRRNAPGEYEQEEEEDDEEEDDEDEQDDDACSVDVLPTPSAAVPPVPPVAIDAIVVALNVDG